VGIILAYSLLDSLFVQAKKNGEDAIVLNFVSPAKRSELFTAKSLTYITSLGLFTLLGFIIPYGIIMLTLGAGIPAAFPLLVL